MRLRERAAPRSLHREANAIAAALLRQAIERDVEELGLGPAMEMCRLEDEATVVADIAGTVHAVMGRALDGDGDYVATATRPTGEPWAPLARGEALDVRRRGHHERLLATIVGEIERLGIGPATQRTDRHGRLRVYDRDRRVHAVIGRWRELGPEEVAQTLYGSMWPPSDRPTARARPPHAYDEHPLTLAVVRSIEARGAKVRGRTMSSTGALELHSDDGAHGIQIGPVLARGAIRAIDSYGRRWVPWGMAPCPGVGWPSSFSQNASFTRHRA